MAADADSDVAVAASGKPEDAEKPAASTVVQAPARGERPGAPLLTLAAHPRAANAVARAKSLGGLVGFLLGGYLSLPTHTLPAAAVRALLAGAFCYVAVWAAAVFLWRRLVVAELRNAEHQLLNAELSRLGVFDRPTGPQQRARAAS